MNPSKVRSAIIDGLDARSAFDDIPLHRYPAGDLAERPSGFALGIVEPVSTEDVSMAGTQHIVEYSIDGALWVGIDGGSDDAYATGESSAMALLQDFRSWIIAVDHGKGLGITDVTVDYLELTDWELSFPPLPDSAMVAFTITVIEVV